MTTRERSPSTAEFDEMLARNRRELDALYEGPASAEPAPPPARRTPPPDDTESETVRTLNARYGDGWRCDVIDRRREGDEIVVLCRLTIGEDGVARTQFGGARIGGGGTRTAGRAGGVPFGFGSGGPASAASPAEAEERAYARAVDEALARCAAML